MVSNLNVYFFELTTGYRIGVGDGLQLDNDPFDFFYLFSDLRVYLFLALLVVIRVGRAVRPSRVGVTSRPARPPASFDSGVGPK